MSYYWGIEYYYNIRQCCNIGGLGNIVILGGGGQYCNVEGWAIL